MDGGTGAMATTTGYALVAPLFKRRIAGPGWSDAGITRLICVGEALRIVAVRLLMVTVVLAPPRFNPDRLAVEPG